MKTDDLANQCKLNKIQRRNPVVHWSELMIVAILRKRHLTPSNVAAGYQALSTILLPFLILSLNILFDLLNRSPPPLGTRNGENLFSTHSLWCIASHFARFLVHKCEVNAAWTHFNKFPVFGY